MPEKILTINVPNIISITVMALVGFTVIGLVTHLVSNQKAG